MNNSQEHEYVDLGLPSGTLWATCNVGASKPEDYGDYFAWGETKKKDVYDWNTYKHAKGAFDKLTKYCYNSNYGYNGFADTLTELQPIDDPATANWGNGWYTPKKEQWDELMAHTNSEWTTRNGVKGWLFTSWSNGKRLFLPAASFRLGDCLDYDNDQGYYWSGSLYFDNPGRALDFFFCSHGYYVDYVDGIIRCFGLSVRAVRSAQLYVDLGLPSGTLWATCNVGASKPEDYGDYFAWGETKKKDVYDWDTYKHAKGAIDKLTKYCNESDYGYDGFADTLTELQPIDDPATTNWGNGWYTPKKEQWDELMAHTNREWTTMNGVEGWLFTSKRNGKSLFLPAAGLRWNDELNGAGSFGSYWSSSLDTSYSDIAGGFYFNSIRDDAYFGYDRYNGLSVRAVRSAQLDMNCCPEHEYVDLGLPSGTLWATCNIGANQPEDYGDCFSWDLGITAAAKWGKGWRMPSKEQWEELRENTISIWTTRNGVNGRLFTSNNGNSLFLPAARYHWVGVGEFLDSNGDYWSSSLDMGNPYYAWYFYFDSGKSYVISYYCRRDYGPSVRAVRSARQN